MHFHIVRIVRAVVAWPQGQIDQITLDYIGAAGSNGDRNIRASIDADIRTGHIVVRVRVSGIRADGGGGGNGTQLRAGHTGIHIERGSRAAIGQAGTGTGHGLAAVGAAPAGTGSTVKGEIDIQANTQSQILGIIGAQVADIHAVGHQIRGIDRIGCAGDGYIQVRAGCNRGLLAQGIIGRVGISRIIGDSSLNHDGVGVGRHARAGGRGHHHIDRARLPRGRQGIRTLQIAEIAGDGTGCVAVMAAGRIIHADKACGGRQREGGHHIGGRTRALIASGDGIGNVPAAWGRVGGVSELRDQHIHGPDRLRQHKQQCKQAWHYFLLRINEIV